jgi:hypothetical protein
MAAAGAAAAPAGDRPVISVAVGYGASVESTGFSPSRTELIPTFFAVGGFGAGRVGLDFALTASSAAGRYRLPDTPVDRLGADVMLVVRPWAVPLSEPASYGKAVLGSLAAEVGLGYEHDSRGLLAGSRAGIRGGARLELPLPFGDDHQLRLRLAVRRLFGLYTPKLEEMSVGDTALEGYAAIALSF